MSTNSKKIIESKNSYRRLLRHLRKQKEAKENGKIDNIKTNIDQSK